MLYSLNGAYPKPIGNRIRLSNGKTRTDSSTFTEEELIDAGYQLAPDIPEKPDNVTFCKLEWNGTDWEYRVTPLITEIEDERQNVLNQINDMIQEARFIRKRAIYNGTPDNNIDAYITDLNNLIVNIDDPINVNWPSSPITFTMGED